MIALLAAPGASSPSGGFATVVLLWIEAGGVAFAWILGSLGIGLALTSPLRVSSSAGLALGVGAMMWLAQTVGGLGAFAGRAGVFAAWAPCALGIGLLVLRLRRSGRPESSFERFLPNSALVGVPALALLAVAACLPPGTVWRSEAHGFDVLSYHLQLPKEWLALGRITPLEHNAYSWLPSVMESAFTQLGAMLGGGAEAIIGGQGLGATGAQMLHSMLTVAAALVIGRTALVLTERGPGDTVAFKTAGAVGALALGVPWVIVVGSSAYNEGAALLMAAGALRVALDRGVPPVFRGLVCGLLMGAATNAKPTAFFMAALPVGAVLLVLTPPRRWAPMLGAGCIGGLVMLAPWLLRNWAAGGNPVFPYLSSVFGTGHWTALELDRWQAGHHVAIPIIDRLALLFSVDRGVFHPQWALFPVMVVAAVPLALRRSPARPLAVALLAAVVVQLLCWLSVGHLQARFLLPLVAPGSLLIALALGAVRAWRPGIAMATGILLALAVALASVRVFLSENGGAPNRALVQGVPALTGEALRSAWPRLTAEERLDLMQEAPPAAFANLSLPGSTIYLLGDSTPFYFQGLVLYHTTWDRSPLGDALELHGGELGAALTELRDQGVTHVLVNLDEYARLTRDKWYDPRISPEIVQRVIAEGGSPIRSWNGSGPLGTILIELEPVQGGGAP